MSLAYWRQTLARHAFVQPYTRWTRTSLLSIIRKTILRTAFGERRADDLATAWAARELEFEGYTRLGTVLDDVEVDALVSYSDTLLCCDASLAAQAEERFLARSPPETCHAALFDRRDLIADARILDLANGPKILEVATRFLGGAPTISDIGMGWSYANREDFVHAERFCRNYDGIRRCKLLICLTDVHMGGGPHVYVRASANDYRLVSSNLMSAVGYDDDIVERVFGAENIHYLCGRRGSAFFVDTLGIHKALLPRTNDRLLLRVEYSRLPLGYKTPGEEERVPYYGNYDRYVNRLLFL